MAVSVALANGDSVIVYQTSTGVLFDELDSSLTPVQLGTAVSAGMTSWIDAQALADGGFSVEWDAQGVLMAQDFNAAGAATDQPHAGAATAALALAAFSSDASTQNGTGLAPVTAVLPLPTGGYVTSYYEWGLGTAYGEIQQYNALGAPVAPTVTTNDFQALQAIKFAPLADGSYLAEIVDDSAMGAIYIDHFSAAGALVSQTTAYRAAVFDDLIDGYSAAGLADGGYVLAWTAPETANGALLSTIGVFVQEYSASGDAVGSPELVGVDAGQTDTPRIEALPDGRYVVAWSGTGGPQDRVFTEAAPALGVQDAPAPTPPPRNGFSGDGRSDFLIENANGAVVLGEAEANGQAVYGQIGGLGPEWRFVGSGDFPAVGFLIENANTGAVVLGTVQNGQAQYAQVAGLGPEWSFAGAGDFLGEGADQVLIQNTSGSVVAGDVRSGHASWTQVASLGADWKIVGCGDFLGDGRADFLVENTNSGAIDAGEVGAGGQANYTQTASLGPEWKFVGVGDFLGDGKTDFLIENADNGAVVAGEVGAGGRVSYTQVAMLGPEWTFVGAGDFLGEGHAQFLIEHTTGLVAIGDVRNGRAVYSEVGALGQEWRFHG